LWQAKILPIKFLKDAEYPVRADTTTEYTVGGGDGMVMYSVSDSTWSEVRDGDGTDAYDSTQTYPLEIVCKGTGSSDFKVNRRAFYPFDLSSLSGATISGASLFLYTQVTASADGLNVGNINVTEVTRSSNSALATSDYNIANWSSTKLSDSIYTASSITDGGWTEWTFNSSGISSVDDAQGGWYSIGLRFDVDIDDSSVSPANDRSQINAHFTESANDPYLEVTYTEGGGEAAPQYIRQEMRFD